MYSIYLAKIFHKYNNGCDDKNNYKLYKEDILSNLITITKHKK